MPECNRTLLLRLIQKRLLAKDPVSSLRCMVTTAQRSYPPNQQWPSRRHELRSGGIPCLSDRVEGAVGLRRFQLLSV